jgi:hypothetical protein
VALIDEMKRNLWGIGIPHSEVEAAASTVPRAILGI